MNIQKLIGHTKGFIKKELPMILTSFAATTSVGALILSVKAEKNAQKRIDAAGTTTKVKDDDEVYVWNPPTKKTQALIYLDEFIPVAVVEILSVGAMFGSQFENQRRIAGLTNALTLATARADALENKIEEKFGKEAADEIKEEIKQDGVDEKLEEMGNLPAGSYLFKDPHYKQFIICTEKEMLRAINAANSIFEGEGYVVLGTFYYYLDKQPPAASMVEGFTWEQVVEDWGEVKIPITYSQRKTKAGATYFEIEYNCDIRTVLTAEDVLVAHYG